MEIKFSNTYFVFLWFLFSLEFIIFYEPDNWCYVYIIIFPIKDDSHFDVS